MDALKAISERIGDRGKLVVLTGAGISAESGIPTFRGPEGFWTLGSKEYRPEEIATYRMFSSRPEEIWQWYLYRIGLCRKAEPNAAHFAVVQIGEHLGNRFLLITQNVDGLHLRAGSSIERTYQIHGNIEHVRCLGECTGEVYPLPPEVSEKTKEAPLDESDRTALKCPRCGGWLRPHVLWFDEAYDEIHYRFSSSIKAAVQTDVLITVGTSGATNLPMQVGVLAAERGALLVDVNPNPNPFSALAERTGGQFLQGSAGQVLPNLVDSLNTPI